MMASVHLRIERAAKAKASVFIIITTQRSPLLLTRIKNISLSRFYCTICRTKLNRPIGTWIYRNASSNRHLNVSSPRGISDFWPALLKIAKALIFRIAVKKIKLTHNSRKSGTVEGGPQTWG